MAENIRKFKATYSLDQSISAKKTELINCLLIIDGVKKYFNIKIQDFFILPGEKEKLLESKPSDQSKQQEEVFRSSTETELTNVKELKSKLRKKITKFTSGSIGRHIVSWQALTNDKDILSTVSGMPIEFGDENVSLEGPTFEIKFSLKEKKFLNEEIEKLLKKLLQGCQNMKQGNLSHQLSNFSDLS